MGYFEKNKRELLSNAFTVFKIALASGLSWELAKLAGSVHPYLAPLSVMLCLQSSVVASIRFSLRRILGTVIGVIVVILAAEQFSLNGWTLGFLILVGGLIVNFLKFDIVVIHQAVITILLVFVFEKASGHYAVDRIRDTAIGAATAVVIQVLLSLWGSSYSYVKRVDRHSKELAASFEVCAKWLENGSPLSQGTVLKKQADELYTEFLHDKKRLRKSLGGFKISPIMKRKKEDWKRCKSSLEHQDQGYQYLLETMGILLDWSASGWMESMDRRIWAMQLEAVSRYFQSLKSTSSDVQFPDFAAIYPIAKEKDRFHIAQYYHTEQFIKRLRI
ncbi:FUSC family protein [Falsibacillus pallidus]|uniref:Fusaric acid resistance family protein n=1 Tax=Falsibacillus pallidus TaxID=493781 RepID=A0A370GFD6_9BACI|nr:FUSC family protein [Falsibacillus pallidus]RDI41906.1 fusaric acid resistance family protein [Falsibacillus pallidus]